MDIATKLTTFFLLLASPTIASERVTFTPPSDWMEADPSALSPSIQIGYVAGSKGSFSPSLNLATEKVSVSLEEYLKAVKQIHESNRKNKWRRLGKIETLAGPAELTELETTSPTGKIRIMQMIFLKEDKAYILTATALKEEFPKFYSAFQKTFQSFKVIQ